MNSNSSNEKPLFEPVTSFDRKEFLQRAKTIGEIGEAGAYDADRNGHVSEELIQAIKDAQLADLWKPRRYGGLGIDLKSYYDIIRITSHHNMATGWLSYFYSIHEVWVGYLQPEGREEVYGDGGLVADVLAPLGTIEKEGDGYRISGQWNFGSGILHSSWVGLGAIAQLPDGDVPEYCLFVMPVSECEIIKNWDTLGMRATGSNGVTLNKAYVPPHRLLPASRVLSTGTPAGGEFDPDEPIYRMPFLPFFAGCFPAVALGGAERIVNEFQKFTEDRVRIYAGGTSAKTATSSPRVLAELRMRLYEMEGLVDRYRRQLQDWFEERKTVNTDEEKAMMFALRGEVAKGGVDIAIKATEALGGTVLFKGHPVELFTRDLIMLGTHGSHLYEDAMSIYGGALFGGPAHPVW